MRVFVTGGSGWVGQGVVPDLIERGHTVTALAPSQASAAALRVAGAEVQQGSLDDLDLLRDSAAAADGVIHLAFKHDTAFSGNYAAAARADRQAVEAFANALEGSGKPLIVPSGILGVVGVAPGSIATENDGRVGMHGDAPVSGGADRGETGRFVLGLAQRGIRSVLLRLPPTTHGKGDNGFIATVVKLAREKQVAAYVGDGSNRWPAVHRDDAARLFCIALESTAPGTVLHAVAEEGVRIRDVAEVIARRLGVPALSVTPEDAATYVGFLARFWSTDGPASSEITRALTGWAPAGPGLIQDLERGYYFE